MTFYSNPNNYHPVDDAVSVSNNRYFQVVQVADSRGVIIDPYGSSSAATSSTAFGEGLVAELTPVFQLDGIYGLNGNKFEQYSFAGGTVNVDKEISVSTSTTANSYAVIRSKRAVRYRPGQGALCRFTAAFTSGVAGYTQRAGFFSQEQALQIGFDGTKFGVLRQNGGKAHIHEFEITTAATAAETVTITLDGVVYTVDVTILTASGNAAEIAAESFPGWITEQKDNKVRFLSESVGEKTGAFSISSGTLAGTSATLQTGVAHTENWTYREDFSIDKLDGTGPSGVDLDFTKLNVWQINFRWLGAGEMRFAVEDPNNGAMIFFHHIHYSNRQTTVHLDNPSLKVGYVVADLGGAGGSEVSVSGASILGAIEGKILPTTYPVASRGRRGSGMNSTNIVYHLLTVKNPLIFNSKINSRELLVQKVSSLATIASSAPGTMFIYINPSLSNNLVFNSFSEPKAALYSTTLTEISQTLNTPVAAFSITSAAPQTIDLSDLRLIVPPGSEISIGFISSQNINSAEANLMFIED